DRLVISDQLSKYRAVFLALDRGLGWWRVERDHRSIPLPHLYTPGCLVEVDPIPNLPQPEDPLSSPWIQQLLSWPSVRRGAIWHVVHRRS
ncbi:hypothetical protein NQ315_005035, partial [Exocentrus adspersus]